MLYCQSFSANKNLSRACWLLHGFLGSSRNMLTYGKALAQQCPEVGVYALDLPGHGQSQPVASDATLDTMAHDLWQTMEHYAPHAQHRIIGHSFGGRIAMRLQHHYGASIDRLMLLDIGPTPLQFMDSTMELLVQKMLKAPATAPSRAAMKAHLMDQRLPDSLIDWLLLNGKMDASQQFIWQIDRATLCAIQQRERLRDVWPESPILVSSWTCIVGGDSSFVAPTTVQQLQDLGATVHCWPGVGHNIHIEALPRLLQISTAWVKDFPSLLG